MVYVLDEHSGYVEDEYGALDIDAAKSNADLWQPAPNGSSIYCLSTSMGVLSSNALLTRVDIKSDLKIMKLSRVIKINIGQNTLAQTEARRESARLWCRLVKVHQYCRKRRWPWPSKGQLQKHFKGRFDLHSQTLQGIIDKFDANIESTKTKRKEGDKSAQYPWRDQKRFQVVIFKGQSIKQQGNQLILPMGRGRKIVKNIRPRKSANRKDRHSRTWFS
jgi:hypothetical protein